MRNGKVMTGGLEIRLRWVAKFALAVSAVWVSTPPAPAISEAQSAAELVAFFVWGLERNTSIGRPDAPIWSVTLADGSVSRYEIRQVNVCTYDVAIERKTVDPRFDLRVHCKLDLSAVNEYVAWSTPANRTIVKIDGKRWYTKRVFNARNGRLVQEIKNGSIEANAAFAGSATRLNAAFAKFRASLCRGRSS
jgi:hypothetical protein